MLKLNSGDHIAMCCAEVDTFSCFSPLYSPYTLASSSTLDWLLAPSVTSTCSFEFDDDDFLSAWPTAPLYKYIGTIFVQQANYSNSIYR